MSKPTGSRAPKRRRVILCVEDDAANVALFQRVAELRPPVSLLSAAEGKVALDLVRTRKPDVILLDMHLRGGSSGLDVLRELRADPSTAAVPVVVLSADTNPEMARLAAEAGAVAYLTKPFRIDELRAVMDGDHPALR